MIKKHSSIYFYRTKANICLDKLYIKSIIFKELNKFLTCGD